MENYRYFAGKLPVIINVPHAGTELPPALLARFTPEARHLPDTDWHVDRLYAFAHALGAHMLVATHSRYVVDLNRAPDDTSLYPGKFTTGLCPSTLFDAAPVYLEGAAPDKKEIEQRVAAYWRPYHAKLRSLIDGLKATSPRVVLLDAHSICSQVPTLFEGRLPDLNFGTAGGKSADVALADSLLALGKKSAYSCVLNGRFQGGYITRHYGDPAAGISAVQLELAQCNYMDEAYPYGYDAAKAAQLQGILRPVVERLIGWVS